MAVRRRRGAMGSSRVRRPMTFSLAPTWGFKWSSLFISTLLLFRQHPTRDTLPLSKRNARDEFLRNRSLSRQAASQDGGGDENLAAGGGGESCPSLCAPAYARQDRPGLLRPGPPPESSFDADPDETHKLDFRGEIHGLSLHEDRVFGEGMDQQ